MSRPFPNRRIKTVLISVLDSQDRCPFVLISRFFPSGQSSHFQIEVGYLWRGGDLGAIFRGITEKAFCEVFRRLRALVGEELEESIPPGFTKFSPIYTLVRDAQGVARSRIDAGVEERAQLC